MTNKENGLLQLKRECKKYPHECYRVTCHVPNKCADKEFNRGWNSAIDEVISVSRAQPPQNGVIGIDDSLRYALSIYPKQSEGVNDTLNRCTGIPILYGFAEPVEGYAERPQDLVRVLHDMGREVVKLREQLENKTSAFDTATKILAETACERIEQSDTAEVNHE